MLIRLSFSYLHKTISAAAVLVLCLFVVFFCKTIKHTFSCRNFMKSDVSHFFRPQPVQDRFGGLLVCSITSFHSVSLSVRQSRFRVQAISHILFEEGVRMHLGMPECPVPFWGHCDPYLDL